MRLFLSAFGAFGVHSENPSEVLCRQMEFDHEVLPVSYAGVDEFLQSRDFSPYDAWLMMGVNGAGTELQLETVARNWVGTHADVEGVISGPGPIDLRAPQQNAATLWSPELGDLGFEWSTHAGDYLCNYLFFCASSALPRLRIGFLHVPPFEKMSFDHQAQRLAKLTATLAAQ